MKVEPFGTNSFPTNYEVVQSCTLQCTDMSGGNNKFYQLELHKATNKFRIFSCYGRTGTPGKSEERVTTVLSIAEKEYNAIKKDKLKKYKEVKVAVTAKGSEVGNSKILSSDIKQDKVTFDSPKPNIKFDLPTESLVKRLYQEAGDSCKSQLDGSLKTSVANPLGTLTLSQINEGKGILAEVNTLLSKSPNLLNSIEPEVVNLSNLFYSTIPQSIPLRPRDEESRKAWLKKYSLNNKEILDQKYELLDLLSDVQGLIKGFGSDDIVSKYQQIQTEFNYCDPSSKDFDKIDTYVQESMSNSHSWKLRILNLWKISPSSQAQETYTKTITTVGNVRELFHGSGPQNILGICKKGLLLRPPGVYITGSMFGNGIYFADCSTKSSQYSTGRFSGGHNAKSYFMFVADVALGKIKEFTSAQSYLQSAPSGYNSVKGVKGYSLVNNEYIIYDKYQQRLKYLIEFRLER